MAQRKSRIDQLIINSPSEEPSTSWRSIRATFASRQCRPPTAYPTAHGLVKNNAETPPGGHALPPPTPPTPQSPNRQLSIVNRQSSPAPDSG